MDIGSIFLILALSMVVALIVSRPFLVHPREARLVADQKAVQKEHQRSVLLAERDRILNLLEDLEVDRSLGKVLGEDYNKQRELLLKSGAEVLRALDTLKIEDNRKAKKTGVSKEEDELEALISARRQALENTGRKFCPNCGNSLQSGDVFCPRCGVKAG